MPKETPPRVSNRWEGTHTYKKPETEKRRARTVAQLREEAAASSKAKREEAFNRRRGSIAGSTAPDSTPVAALSRRRGSTGGISPVAGPVTESPPATPKTPTPPEESDMPGSGKKSRNRSGGGNTDADENGTGVDPALIRFLNAMKHDIVESTRETVGRIEARLDNTERGLERLEKKVEETDKNLSAKVAAEVARQLPSASIAAEPSKRGTDSRTKLRREEAFHLCRRSLKLWPITGGEDPVDAVRTFLRNRLGIGNDRITRLGTIEVSTLPSKTSRERKEVVATFETLDDRDFVKSNGSNLAGQNEAGMSLHVPGHLMDNLSALNGLAYSIKQKNRNIKRAVKFDDINQDIYLDICVAGNWRRVSPVEARAALKEVPTAGLSESSLSVTDLTSLIQGKEVPGLTVTVVPDDSMVD